MELLKTKQKKYLQSEVIEPLPLKNLHHIAIIMDGNGRWAKKNHLSRIAGHRKGVEVVRDIVIECRKLGLDTLTLYAFSEENWNRPKTDITALMALLRLFLISERGLFQKNDVRLRTIGDTKKLPVSVQRTLNETMRLTQQNKSMSLVLALSYGGREEITRAVRCLIEKTSKGLLSIENINEETVSAHLDTAEFSDPDLLIRTSGEYRTSNFLPWQLIYTEFYVTQTLWPDFSVQELHHAIADYERRERRFGLVSEQLQDKEL